MLTGHYDVLVIGAGPAGSTAAIRLKRAGYQVAVVEQTRFPRFVIGESLLPRCMDLLDEVGLLPRLYQQNYIIKRGALFLEGDRRCEFDFSEQYVSGRWDHTWQVPRAHFDNVLAEAAVEAGVPIFFEHTVREADVADEPRLVLERADGSTVKTRAHFILDASGYGRVLPRLLGIEAPSNFPPRKALFAHVLGDRRPPGPQEGRIWVVILPRQAWVWIIPFSDGRTSVGAVAHPDFFDAYPEDPTEALHEILASDAITVDRLRDARIVFGPRTIAGYAVSVKKMWGQGFCLVGNATEFLDPVFSSGVTLALESSQRASHALIRELRGETVDWQTEFEDYMRRGTDVFRTFVETWYDGTLPRIFLSESQDPAIKAMMCSVLAGYVWDTNNPFVAQHRRKVAQLARLAGSGAPV